MNRTLKNDQCLEWVALANDGITSGLDTPKRIKDGGKYYLLICIKIRLQDLSVTQVAMTPEARKHTNLILKDQKVKV